MSKGKNINIRLSDIEKQSIECEAYKEGVGNSEYLLKTHKAWISKNGYCPFCNQKIVKS